MEELEKAMHSAESAMKMTQKVNIAHRNHLSTLFVDLVMVIKGLIEALDPKDDKIAMLLKRCDSSTSKFQQLSINTKNFGTRMSEAETTGSEGVSDGDTSGSDERLDRIKGA